MSIDKLIAWHRRSSPRTNAVWATDAVRYYDLVIFHRNAVKLLESINHDKTV